MRLARLTIGVLGVLLAALGLGAGTARADCRQKEHDGQLYSVCEAEIGRDDLRIWHSDGNGRLIGTFGRLDQMLAAEGGKLGFAMNAGMYHPDRRAVGLLVVEGQQMARLITSDGPGNFGLLPNGVFCIGVAGYRVIESRRYAEGGQSCDYASQSGPMLVIDGGLHPRFLRSSDSRYIRNGVGVSADGRRAVFAISRNAVNFHEFARLFRDGLGLPNALYFDGNISRLHAPELDRSDGGFPMGPIVGTLVRQ